MTTRILVLGDPHAHARYDNDRFERAGALARQRRVDRVHCVGDWTDFPSVNPHKSMLEARGVTYEGDVAAGNDALLRFDEGLDGHPCRKTITLGNHDTYPLDYIERRDPSLEGSMRADDVRFKAHGWAVTPFRERRRVSGLTCSHWFPRKGGRPISTARAALDTAKAVGDHAVSGHSHVFDHGVVTYLDGRQAHGFVAGCWTNPRYREPWAKDTVDLWHVGLLIVSVGARGVLEGFEWVSEAAVRREVGR